MVDDGVTKGTHVGFVALGKLEDPGGAGTTDGATEDAAIKAVVSVVAVRTTHPCEGGGLRKNTDEGEISAEFFHSWGDIGGGSENDQDKKFLKAKFIAE